MFKGPAQLRQETVSLEDTAELRGLSLALPLEQGERFYSGHQHSPPCRNPHGHKNAIPHDLRGLQTLLVAKGTKDIAKIDSWNHLHYPGAEMIECLKLCEHTPKPRWLLPPHPPTSQLKAEELGTYIGDT